MGPQTLCGSALIVLAVAGGCGSPPPLAGAPPTTTTTAPVTVARLTPEQMSKSFVAALGTDYGIVLSQVNPVDQVEFYSYVARDFAVPLGGVDFLAHVRDRDPLTKVQTLLVSRAVAWPLALQIVQKGLELPTPPDTLFVLCDIAVDRPSGDAASAARWEAQLQDFYLRLFARQATPEELARIAQTFERVAAAEDDTGAAWLVTVYALLASLETWHSWR